MKKRDVNYKYGPSVFDGGVGGMIGKGILAFLAFVVMLAIGVAGAYFLATTLGAVDIEFNNLEQITILPEKTVLEFVGLGGAALVFLFFFLFGICWSFCIMQRWAIRHTIVGGYRLVFKGKAIGLWGNYIKWGVLCIITLFIYSFWVPVKFNKWLVKHTLIAEQVEGAPNAPAVPANKNGYQYVGTANNGYYYPTFYHGYNPYAAYGFGNPAANCNNCPATNDNGNKKRK